MSEISSTVPLDGENASNGATRLREERQWLYDLWQAYKVRHQAGSVPNDPGTAAPGFNVPFAPPGTLRIGDIHFSASGLMFGVGTGPASRQLGCMERATPVVFRMSAAPNGWTRDVTSQNNSVLRYIGVGDVSFGGSQNIATAWTHSSSVNTTINGGGSTPTIIKDLQAHTGLKYLDVILASKN